MAASTLYFTLASSTEPQQPCMLAENSCDIYCSPVPRHPTNLRDKQTQHQHMRREQGLHMCNKSSIVQHCYSSIKLSAVGKEQVELWNIQDCCCLQKALGSKLPAHQHGQTVHNWLKIINSANDYIHFILVLHFQPDSWVFFDLWQLCWFSYWTLQPGLYPIESFTTQRDS